MVGVPPSLPLLALTVLAASLMQREGDVASHNFYRRFREQLDPLDDQPGIPGDFGDWIPSLWRQLERWLNEHLGGASGVVVLQSQEALDHNPYGKNIAHAINKPFSGYQIAGTFIASSEQSVSIQKKTMPNPRSFGGTWRYGQHDTNLLPVGSLGWRLSRSSRATAWTC